MERELATPQVIVMGRITYELLAGQMAGLPKVVVSNTLTEPLDSENTTLLRGDVRTSIAALKRESDVPLRTIGSLSLVRSLVELELADRLRLVVFPLTLGAAGREPVFDGFPAVRFTSITSRVLDGRLVELVYAR